MYESGPCLSPVEMAPTIPETVSARDDSIRQRAATSLTSPATCPALRSMHQASDEALGAQARDHDREEDHDAATIAVSR